MSVAYVDASLIVSLLDRTDSNHEVANRWIRSWREEIVSSVIAEVEVSRALARRQASVAALRQVAGLFATFEPVAVSPQIRSTAAALTPRSLRSLDAIHVATAVVAQVDWFATLDLRQSVGAEEAGLRLAL